MKYLCLPSRHARRNWSRVFFQCIGLVHEDLTLPILNVIEEDVPIEFSQDYRAMKYFTSCVNQINSRGISGIEGHSTTKKASSSNSDPHADLNHLINCIYLMFQTFSILCFRCKLNSGSTNLSSVQANQLTVKAINDPQIRPSYHILASFLAAGCCGLMLCPQDHRKFGVSPSFQLLMLASQLNRLNSPPIKETIWRRLNQYICDLFSSAFPSPQSFHEVHIARYDLACAIILDLGEFFHRENPNVSSYVVSLPRSAPRTTNVTVTSLEPSS